MLGDPPGFPEPELTGFDAGPDPWEAVLDLEGGADVPLGGVGGHAQGGAELHDRELADHRCPGAGQGDAVVAERGVGIVVGLVQ
ncbi:hypothetical protein [Nocardioides sp. cx-173]|uniref:hypothetical protein n=1 Tax=Nocardioides sp. cx-173 TaxID=2898796 RepID=UPI001E53204D|nr:hypothetical protein [Nocardioides sp. cx-173]MCD4527343.1 hypothetical protein [Nocardioides sp. cx-173]UGB43640.1 hypothetical protein LQ940_08965 [Nocardioides sp. cx-173]